MAKNHHTDEVGNEKNSAKTKGLRESVMWQGMRGWPSQDWGGNWRGDQQNLSGRMPPTALACHPHSISTHPPHALRSRERAKPAPNFRDQEFRDHTTIPFAGLPYLSVSDARTTIKYLCNITRTQAVPR